MYITIRAFRNYGEMVPAGVIVEPAQIRRFKDKVRDGKIVEITDNNKSKYEAYVSRMLQKEFTVDTAEKYVGVRYGTETPDTPDIPDTPDTLDTPDTPDTHDTHDTPEGTEGTEGAEGTEGTEDIEEAPVQPQTATAVKPKVVAAVSKEA